tara:strand:- start:385 stop:555 length:171 start_codon:yes stop_codon:yes gene_type:complete
MRQKDFTFITAKKTGPLSPISLLINNYTLASTIGNGVSNGYGQCLKGFKEYNEKQV